MVTLNAFSAGSKVLGCSDRDLRTVVKVESGGMGIEPTKKRPIILFEPHVFFRCLHRHVLAETKSAGAADAAVLDASYKHPTICYKKWGERPYPLVLLPNGKPDVVATQDLRYAQQDLAATVHREAALEACSWGLSQILGEYWKETGVASLQEFVNQNYASEDAQMLLMVHMMKGRGMGPAIAAHKWDSVAAAWNGTGNVKEYSKRLAQAWLALGNS